MRFIKKIEKQKSSLSCAHRYIINKDKLVSTQHAIGTNPSKSWHIN